MTLAEQVKTLLQSEIAKYPRNQKKIRAEICLQHLVDDGILDAADCRYRRNDVLERDGLTFVIRKDNETLERFAIGFDTTIEELTLNADTNPKTIAI